MTPDEVIIFKNVKPEVFMILAQQAIKYALVSVAFTYNRMDKNKLSDRINNITKGKIAEYLFFHYCGQNGIKVEPDPCHTPFWMPDNRDFFWLGGEWDIKNNYFYCSDKDFKSFDCTLLPALIPNKSTYDQWSKRNHHLITSSRFNAYVFTFIRLDPKERLFFNTNLNEDQLMFIISIVNTFNKGVQKEMPFDDSWFFQTLNEKGPTNYISLRYCPELIITGCANPRYWHLFRDIPPEDVSNPYLNYQDNSNWYHNQHGVVSFLNGVFVTKIRNRVCPVSFLPSFQSIVHRLKN